VTAGKFWASRTAPSPLPQPTSATRAPARRAASLGLLDDCRGHHDEAAAHLADAAALHERAGARCSTR